MSTTSAGFLEPVEPIKPNEPMERQGPMETRTLLLGNRLFLAANTMLMLAMLFAYLFLRSQNYGGNWRPDGIADLSGIPMAITLLLQLGCLVAVVAALAAARRGAGVRAIGVIALLLGLAAGAARVWYQYNLGDGWVINTRLVAGQTVQAGTYTAVSEMWFGIFIVEVLLGCLWLLSIVAPGPRSHDRAASLNHLRAFSEFWLYLLVASTFVWLLVRLV
jgi:heme/copper-type cytochrome/quinol oxidase subunit 3